MTEYVFILDNELKKDKGEKYQELTLEAPQIVQIEKKPNQEKASTIIEIDIY